MGVYYNIGNDLEIRERKSQLLVESICKDLNPMDWRRKWQPTPVFLPGESQGWRSLVGYSPWGRKEWDTTELLQFFIFFNFSQFYEIDRINNCI